MIAIRCQQELGNGMFLFQNEFKAWACKTYNISEATPDRAAEGLASMNIDATFLPVAIELIENVFPPAITISSGMPDRRQL